MSTGRFRRTPGGARRPEVGADKRRLGPSRYRWAVLAAGTGAQAAFSSMTLGLPVLAPAVREEFDLSLSQVGVFLGAEWIGLILSLLLWGIAVDRFGERRTLAAGMGGCAACLAGAAFAPGFASLVVLIALAGAVGGSVQSGSGSAIVRWFGPEERGLALGIRQTAVPVGGLLGAVALPAAVAGGGVRAAFLLLAGLCALGAAGGAVVLRKLALEEGVEPGALAQTLKDWRLWTVSWGSGLYLVAQIAILGFLVLYLHDERGFSTSAAAGVLAGVNVLAAAFRIGAGRWSDVLRTRIVPLRRIGLAVAASLGAAALLTRAPTALLVPAFVLSGGLSMAWNGLSFAAAAELAGGARSGAAIGFQQTVLSVIGAVVPPVFAVLVEATSWQVAFGLAALGPLAGWAALTRVRDR